MPTRPSTTLEVARGRPAPRRERAGDDPPGALRRRRPGATRRRAQLYEASAEVGRLEARDPLRRRRPPARRAAAGAAEGADRAVGRAQGRSARPRLETLAEQAVDAEEQADAAGRAGRGAGACSCPTSKTRCAQAQSARQRAARRGRAGAAADPGAGRRPAQHRGAVAPAERSGASASWRTATRWPRPTTARLANLQQQLAARAGSRRDAPMRACTSCRSRCRSSTRTAARRSRTVNAAGRAPGRPVGAPGSAARRCRRRSDRRQAQPWLAKHGLDGLQGLWTQASTSSRAGRARWKRRCASA